MICSRETAADNSKGEALRTPGLPKERDHFMDYQVDLATFRGPLDLLLFLVKRHEVEIFDIPIAQVSEQFFEYLNAIRDIDVELAGEFLVMAATLMESMSRMLLPHVAEGPTDAGAPPHARANQLGEY